MLLLPLYPSNASYSTFEKLILSDLGSDYDRSSIKDSHDTNYSTNSYDSYF
jgi:hypothetical protein